MENIVIAPTYRRRTEVETTTSPCGAWEDTLAGHETERLAAYAAALAYEELPAQVLQRAKDCICDTVAAIIFGAELPWSKMIVTYARASSGAGRSSILGGGGPCVHAGAAALANGAMAHAFELDTWTKPTSGSHPGATVFTAALAVAQDRDLTGRDLLAAFVAGSEVMIRIGHATKHSNEERGFHAPGTTGPFGAAVACGRLMGFDAAHMANALGIAGSCAGGLLQFARVDNGAMVKRLHIGRAAEAGVLAASLAGAGFTGPINVLEGEFGFLHVICNHWDLAELVRGLGETYFTMDITFKRYACHGTAQNAVQAILDLRAEHQFAANDVASITIGGSERMAKATNIAAPRDKMLAQYSIPFSVALSFYRDPMDPRSFDDGAVRDRAILDLAARTRIAVIAGQDFRDHSATATVRLKDGKELSRRVTSFKGTPERPLDRSELREKFLLLTARLGRERMAPLFDRLQDLDSENTLDWLDVQCAVADDGQVRRGIST